MHVQRVTTNETCNQNCWFCNARRPAESPDFVRPAAVRRRIAAALGPQTREVVLTGGEPTMRSDLAALVRAAAAGAGRVALETNATLIDEARAAALAGAGLAVARVQLVAWGAEADAITRQPGGFAAALRGIRALAGAGITVEVTTPIVRRTLAHAPTLPGQIVAEGLPVAALVLIAPATAPDADECAPLADLGRAITAVADEARRVAHHPAPRSDDVRPPCVFERPERVAPVRPQPRQRGATGLRARGGVRGVPGRRPLRPGLPRAAAAAPPRCTRSATSGCGDG
ncbi:MAG: radical SAM protein [Candidatus Binatia bacterium]